MEQISTALVFPVPAADEGWEYPGNKYWALCGFRELGHLLTAPVLWGDSSAELSRGLSALGPVFCCPSSVPSLNSQISGVAGAGR